MSSWGKKLEKKLNGLADTASKESIQTLSNWIAFNRKHAQTIATVLTNALQDFKDNEKRQWLFWQIIHEILVRERGNEPKWEKLGQLRLTLGEALQPAMKSLGNNMPEQLESYVEEWEDHDVFGGPSLNAQIRRIYQSRKNLTTVDSTKATKASVSPTEKASVSSATETQASSTISTALGQTTSQTPKLSAKASTISGGGGKDQSTKADTNNKTGQNDNDDDEVAGKNIGPSEEAHGKSPSPQRRNSALKEQVEYDFESKGVPSGQVESRDFLDPCKAITTLQIARDIRTNTAVEISTALENLPADIQTACQELDDGTLQELDTATTNEFSIRIPPSLIDLDIDEETSSLNMFQDIVQRQQKAREKLIYLLLRSRCKFGSREAAQEFYEIENLGKKLKKRKELLSDALELEGLDPNEIGSDVDTNKKRDFEQVLPSLTWYKPDDEQGLESGDGQSTVSKKPRTL